MSGKTNITGLFDVSGNLTVRAMEKYLRGELSMAEREIVQKHLAGSEFDREALEGMQKLATGEFRQEVEDMHAEILAVVGRRVKPVNSNIYRRKYWYAAAGMAGLIGLSVLMFYLFREPVENHQLAVIHADTLVNKTTAVVLPLENNAKKEEENLPVTGQKIQIEPTSVAAPEKSSDIQKVIEEPFQPVADLEAIESYESAIVADETGAVAEKDDDVAEEDVQMEVPVIGGIAVEEERGNVEKKHDGNVKRTGSSDQVYSKSAVSKGRTGVTAHEPDSTELFVVVEKMPEFPGGEEALNRYLNDSIHYPEPAIENNIQGTVYIRFIVEKDGSITDITVLRGIGGGCDEEAVRVIKSMPNWIPGKQRGKPVRVAFTIPVKFDLDRSGSP
jgi:TonB family protein